MHPIVYLNSNGGDVRAAIEIGRILRKNLAWTFVDPEDVCNSSCVVIFMSGVVRYLTGSAELGVHRPRFSDSDWFGSLDFQDAGKVYAEVMRELSVYTQDMNIPDAVMDLIMEVPSYSIERIDRERADGLGITGVDPIFQEWRDAIDPSLR
jgi:hypothetical protein